jgi:hypothetical protein
MRGGESSMGEVQRRTPFHQQPYSTAHRSFQDDKVIVSTEWGQHYSRNNQSRELSGPPCGRDDKVIVIKGR